MVITFCCAKGGVGKTTLASNLAIQALINNKKVCLVDLDSQANISLTFNVAPNTYTDVSLLDYLNKKKDLNQILDFQISNDFQAFKQKQDIKGTLAILHASNKLSEFTYLVEKNKIKTQDFIKMIQTINEKFDYVIIDTAPSLNLLTKLAILSADKVVIPFKTNTNAFYGVTSILDLLNTKEYQNKIRFTYIVSNGNKEKALLTRAYSSEMKSNILENKYENVKFLDLNVSNSSNFDKYVTSKGMPLSCNNSQAKNNLKIQYELNSLYKEIFNRISNK